MSRLPIRSRLVLSQSPIFLFARPSSRPAATAAAATRALSSGAISTPKVAQPSFWKSLVPKFMRRSTAEEKKKAAQKGWNPATYFIVMFLMIGSMSIQMIALKKDFATFTRRTDVRITLLRETVEKLQRGEKVDVERVLGTGDPEHEQQWEDVLKEIERDEVVQAFQKKQQQEKAQAADVKSSTAAPTEQPKSATTTTSTDTAGFF